MRAEAELREASGYASSPKDFHDLLRILDIELRLITPVDPEASIDDHAPSVVPAREGSYQLTHDYLVHSLRDWLTRKQRETRKGRAELVLAERAAIWGAKPETRNLPSVAEWANIHLFTERRGWTEPQQMMIRQADRLIGLRAIAMALLVAAILASGLILNRRAVEATSFTHASGLVNQLLRAEISQVPTIAHEMRDYRRWTEPALARVVESADDGTKAQLHANLALLSLRGDQLEYVYDRLATAGPPETAVILGTLRPFRGKLTDRLWNDLGAARPEDSNILPLASVLANFDPSNPRWAEMGDRVAAALVRATLDHVAAWQESLWKVRGALTDPLAAIYRDQSRPELDHIIATTLLARYAQERPGLVVDLLLDADPKSFSVLFPVVQSSKDATLAERLWQVASTAHGDPSLAGYRIDPAAPPGSPTRPEESREVCDRRAARGARAAVALVHLGHSAQVWGLLVHSPDPSMRTNLISAFQRYGVAPGILIQQLDQVARAHAEQQRSAATPRDKNAYLFDAVASSKRALIQALAAYPRAKLLADEGDALLAILVDLYCNDPDAGVHSAAELVLRRWGRKELSDLCFKSPRTSEQEPCRWSINSAGQIMALIDEPGEFQMGSAPTDPERENGDVFHRRSIPRRFAMATKEVTIKEFEVFQKETGRPPVQYSRRYGPDRDGPQVKVSWFDAVEYCNWLSAKEGLQPCYEFNDERKLAKGMRVNAAAVAAGAYRLPTEAEWEYACRAGGATGRYFGNSLALLKDYEWYVDTSGEHAHACGMLLPNDLGLFDMLGNATEWCHDRFRDQERSFEQVVEDAIDSEVVNDDHRMQRGLTFRDTLRTVRVGTRGWFQPFENANDYGFRPARTVPPQRR
jgi:formylglycine-generating enzyme required for sulfatase activity